VSPVAPLPAAVGSPPFPRESYRLATDVYLDCRHADFVWFEHVGLIRAPEVVIAPGVLEVLLALAGTA